LRQLQIRQRGASVGAKLAEEAVGAEEKHVGDVINGHVGAGVLLTDAVDAGIKQGHDTLRFLLKMRRSHKRCSNE
jgi:hypothetical protein